MSITDVSLSEKFGVEPIPEQPAPVIVPTAEDSDVDRARQVLRTLIDQGETAVQDILFIADQTESARSYEVAATMIKTIADVAKDLVAIQKSRSSEETKPTIGTQTNTNVFVGSTAELMKMLKKTAIEEIEYEVVEEIKTDE